MIKWKFDIITSIILLLSVVLFADDAALKERFFGSPETAGAKSDVRVSNDDIGIMVENSGMFSIGTTDGKSLLYGYPYSARTSHSHFYVDGVVTGSYADSASGHPPMAEVLESPHRVGDTIMARWRNGNVEFTQLISPTYIGEDAQAKIQYRIYNPDATSHLVGVLLFLDTMIRSNDCAPIATPLGYFVTEREFIGDLPSFWQAFEESPFQEEYLLVGQGTLDGWEATPPDVLLYGDFWHYHSTEWNYTFSGGIYSDSSVLLRWNAQLIHPGETITFITYYGIGSADRSLGDVSLSLTHPIEIIPLGCDEFSPDTFSVNLLVGSGDTLGGAVAELHVPDFLTIIGDAEVPIEPFLLPPGAVGTASWTIATMMPISSQIDTIRAELTAPGYTPVSISKSISIFASDAETPVISLLTSIPSPLITDTLTLEFQITDGDGIDTTSLAALLDGNPVAFSWAHPIMNIYLSGLAGGMHVLTLPEVSDTFGCAAAPFEIVFEVELPGIPEAMLISPAVNRFSACANDTIIIFLSCEAGWTADNFTLKLDGSTMPFGWRGDTILSFFEGLTEGEHVVRLIGDDDTGMHIDSTWAFFMDTSPPVLISAPVLFELVTPSDVMNFAVTDYGSGLDTTSIFAEIAYGIDTVGISVGAPGLTYSAGMISLVLSETELLFTGCEEVSIRVIADDIVSNCGPNRMDTLAFHTIVPCTPPDFILLEPTGNISCDTIDLVILLYDEEGIVVDSAYIMFNDIRYGLDTPNLSIAGDTLLFTLYGAGIPSGELRFYLRGVTDTWGNAISADASVVVVLDKNPPVVTDIFPSGMLTGSETVGFRCVDAESDISDELSFIVCDNDTMRIGEGLGFDGELLFVPAAFWLAALDGESLTVCTHIEDAVVQCEPNSVDTCVHFAVEQSGPAALMMEPLPGSFLGCEIHEFRILVYDPDGVDRSASTIAFAESVYYVNNPLFNWNADTISFDMTLTAISGEFSIDFHGVDELGFSSDTIWTFFADRQPPRISVIEPVPGAQIAEPYQSWKIRLDDGGTGIDIATISMIVDGNLFTVMDESMEFTNDTLIFHPVSADIQFGLETDVAITCADGAKNCPNYANNEWTYDIFHPDLWWELLSPHGITACDTVEVEVAVHSNFDIDFSLCEGTVNDMEISINFRGDTLKAEIPADFLFGGVNGVSIWGFIDAEHVVALDETVFIPVLYDSAPPTIEPMYPPPGSQVGSGSPVRAIIRDDLSGVDKAAVMVSFNDIDIIPSVSNWSVDTISVSIPEDIIGGVEVCIVAADMPQNCDPRETRICWQFSVPGAGPQITLIEPINDAYTHDPQQRIAMHITSENDLNMNEISINFEQVVYEIDDNILRFSGDTLIFTPPTNWNDGLRVDFTAKCEDNMSISSDLYAGFYTDFSPPECSNPKPAGFTKSIPKSISIDISDVGAGVDPQSIVFGVGDLFIPFDNYSLTYTGNRAELDIDRAGIRIGTMDTLNVCVIAADARTGFGEPNIMSNCCFWFFPVKSGCSVGPTPFTPNGDGINDEVEFVVYSKEMLRVSIFTRDGTPIRTIQDKIAARWDGRDNHGRIVPSGPYIYTVEAGGKNLCKGAVVVAR